MKDFRFNYIITIYNKEDLIKDVLLGILECCGDNSYIYPVLDGCTDGTEKIIDEIASTTDVPIEKIYAPDVHEILSINIALKHVPQNEKGCNVLIQDDVILKDSKIEEYIKKVYDRVGYSKVGVLAFRHGVNLVLDHKNKEIKETDLIESSYGAGTCNAPLLAGHLVGRMVGVRSPECISCEVVSRVGIMDEKLAPYTYDNHDYSLRCLEKGYLNFVFSIPFISDVDWGGTRTNPHPEYEAVLTRNKKYLYTKHFDLIKKINKEFSYKDFIGSPFPIVKMDKKIVEDTEKSYVMNRKRGLGTKLFFYIKFVKMPIKRCFYFGKYIVNTNVTRKIKLLFTDPKIFFRMSYGVCSVMIKDAFFNKDGNSFTSNLEKETLQKYASKATVGLVEIGVLDGASTKEIAQTCAVPIYGIDPIIPDSMNKRLIGHEIKIKRNLAFYKDFHFYKDFSYNVVKTWKKKFDFIFIDGDHSYEAVKRDFTDWFPLLEQNGFVAFHDSAPLSSQEDAFDGWSGPIRLVSELKKDARLEFVETKDTLSVFRKK